MPLLTTGGATVTRTEQVVKCHQDDVENFTFVIYGSKTFLVAPPEAVEQGKTYASENHQADTGSSFFRKAVITPGQLLYLPRLWWHEVHTNPDGCMTIGRWVCGELQLSPGAAEPA